jgi:hypothetical protein
MLPKMVLGSFHDFARVTLGPWRGHPAQDVTNGKAPAVPQGRCLVPLAPRTAGPVPGCERVQVQVHVRIECVLPPTFHSALSF